MTRDNFDATLKAFQSLTPFRPFTVTLINGTVFEVDFPTAMVFRDGLAIYVGPGGIPVIFDHKGVSQFTGDLKRFTESE